MKSGNESVTATQLMPGETSKCWKHMNGIRTVLVFASRHERVEILEEESVRLEYFDVWHGQ
jgi:hypothetical protein